MKAVKKIKLFGIILCISSIVLLTACQKKTMGCVDAWANNNCQGCNLTANDVCEYTGEGIFWYQSLVGDSLELAGTDSLSYFIDGQYKGSTSVFHQFWPPGLLGEPPMAYCFDDSTFKYTMTWVGNHEHSFTYSVKNQSGLELWTGSVNLRVMACSSMQLGL